MTSPISSFSSDNSNLKTNVGSLYAQLNLHRNEQGISTLIRNLSSGIQVHSGRDDPAKFISSTILRTEMSSTQAAISSSSKANSVCAVAESALAQVNALLNDIKGMVVEAANTGANTDAMISSLQLQLDSCLDSIDRIANTTKFLDNYLLNGSLDFLTYGVDSDAVDHLQINQANFLGATEKDVSVKVLQNAQPAVLFYEYGATTESTVIQVAGNQGTQVFSFEDGVSVEQIAKAINSSTSATGLAATVMAEATPGNIYISSYGKDNDIIVTASQSGYLEGNFVIKYTAPTEGNSEMYLNVNHGSGTEPTEIEVVLQTQPWTNATYHYNGENDGIAHNEFDWTSKIAGSGYDNLEFEFVNVNGTDEPVGLSGDLQQDPAKITININYNYQNPSDPQNTTVNDLSDWLKNDPVLSAYFEITNSPSSDGTGPLIPTTQFTQTQKGDKGGTVLSTAEQVVTLLNTSPLLQVDGKGIITASLPAGTTGLGTVSVFEEYAYYGTAEQNNQLQFLGPEGSPDIRFVSEPSTPLSVEYTSAKYGKASTTVQGLDANTSFSLRALYEGDQYDGMGIILQDGTEESAQLDPAKNAIVITVDFSGRQSDPSRSAFNMNDMKNLIENSPTLGSLFEFVPFSGYDTANPPEFSSSDYLGMNAKVSTFSGGQTEQGILVVHLETDANGCVLTTAADLVNYFENPTNEEAKAILDQFQISVSLVDPSNGYVANCGTNLDGLGLGLLEPTYTATCDEDGNMLNTDIQFTSFGTDIAYDYASVTVNSSNGSDSSFQIQSISAGSEFNNVLVRIVSDPNGSSVKYNPSSKELTISVDSQNPPTANEIIDLINSDPSVSARFRASNTGNSDGTGIVAVGDQARMTGGIRQVSDSASTITTAQNGIDAVFQVTAKATDSSMDGASVAVVNDTTGTVSQASLSYDPNSKQLTVVINPNNPPTAAEIVDLINNTSEISQLFLASIPETYPGTALTPSGTGTLSAGDGGTLKTVSSGSSLGAPMIGNSDEGSVGLAIYSVDFGSDAFVSVQALGETHFKVVDFFGNESERQTGCDVVALINNNIATGSGSAASIRTNDLDMTVWIDPMLSSGSVFGFRITGGGALMQLGPYANSDNQIRIALKDIHVTNLGGPSGTLSELRSEGGKDLRTDTTGAYKIVSEAIEEISFLRGLIGTVQKYQIETGMEQMSDMLEISSGAYSDLVDTDFAVASSELTRKELLMQAAISVMGTTQDVNRQILSLLQR